LIHNARRLRKFPRFQAAEPFSDFQSAEKYRRSFALLDKPSNPSGIGAQAALDFKDSQAASQTDLRASLSCQHPSFSDRFGRAQVPGSSHGFGTLKDVV
jgi:hypothetical protein